MTTTLEALQRIRAERGAHPEWTVAAERRLAATLGCRVRFEAPSTVGYGDPATSLGATVVCEVDGTICGQCGVPVDRSVLHGSGLISLEHDGHGLGGWACTATEQTSAR